MRVRTVCIVLIVAVAGATGLAGLCEMICAVAGIEHGGALQEHVAERQAAPPPGEHAGHATHAVAAAGSDRLAPTSPPGEHAGHATHAVAAAGSDRLAPTSPPGEHAGHAMHAVAAAGSDSPAPTSTPGPDAPHCPMCADANGCVMTDTSMPSDAALTAGELPRRAPVMRAAAVSAAPPTPDDSLPSRLAPPECEPPRG